MGKAHSERQRARALFSKAPLHGLASPPKADEQHYPRYYQEPGAHRASGFLCSGVRSLLMFAKGMKMTDTSEASAGSW